MKDEEIKRELKKHLMVEAPQGFSDRIMESIAAENLAVKKQRDYVMPGKNLLIILLLFFMGSIVWSFMAGTTSDSKIHSLLDRISPPSFEQVNWLFNNLNSYLMMGFLLFLIIEIISVRKRSVSITV